MARRELLKYFGAGAIIAPLGGSVQAKLIEEPKIEIVKPQPIQMILRVADVKEATVTLKANGGDVHVFHIRHVWDTNPSREGFQFKESRGIIFPEGSARIEFVGYGISPSARTGVIYGDYKL